MSSDFNLLEELKNKHLDFLKQKEHLHLQLNQTIGAIYACEMIIKKHEEEQQKELS